MIPRHMVCDNTRIGQVYTAIMKFFLHFGAGTKLDEFIDVFDYKKTWYNRVMNHKVRHWINVCITTVPLQVLPLRMDDASVKTLAIIVITCKLAWSNIRHQNFKGCNRYTQPTTGFKTLLPHTPTCTRSPLAVYNYCSSPQR